MKRISMLTRFADAKLGGTLRTIASCLFTPWMTLGFAVIAFAGYGLFHIVRNTPSPMQSHESAEICAALKRQICLEAGMSKFTLGDPCGNRDARWSAGAKSSGIEIYGVTDADGKARVISFAIAALDRSSELKALGVRFYDDPEHKNLLEYKTIGRQQP